MPIVSSLLNRLGLNRNSIGRAALLAVGWRISLLIVLLSLGSYYFMQRSLEARVIEKLEIAANARAAKEGEVFRHLKQAHERSAEMLHSVLAGNALEPTVGFDDLFYDKGDGSYRSRDTLYEGLTVGGSLHIRGTGALIPKADHLTADHRKLLTAALQIAVQTGSVYYPEFQSYYFFSPEGDVLIFGPDREDNLAFYRKDAPADFDLTGRELHSVTVQENNPNREFRCTSLQPLISDIYENTWTTGCHLPVDIDGQHIGSFGSSIRLTQLLRQYVVTQLDGGDTMIISGDGKLIMHSRLTKDGEINEKMLDVASSSDAHVEAIYQNILENKDQTRWVSYLDGHDSYVAAAEIEYLGGYFIIAYPHALIAAEAGDAALNMLYLGLIILLVTLLTLTAAMKKTVSDPLNHLLTRTKQLAMGEFANKARRRQTPAAREIDALAASTEKMAFELSQIVGNLERTVSERTKDMEIARDEAERASAAKTDFLANMSHEIRTPLTGIMGMLDLLGQERLSPVAHSNVEMAKKSSSLLLSLVNDILDISRLEAGKLSVRLAPVDIKSAVQETSGSLALLAEQKALTLTVTDEIKQPLWVLTDLKLLRQILINLIGNAIKFTETGGVTVELNSRTVDDETECLALVVSDTGSGMTQAQSSKLFDRFEQAEPTISGEQTGTGLGLAIVKDLVSLLGGDISCLTRKGRGSSFSVSLPVKKCAAPEKTVPVDIKKQKSRPLAGINLLAVDDNEVNRIIIAKICQQLGASIRVLESGEETVSLLADDDVAAQYDALLLDINMPGISGIETLEQLRRANGTAATLPAIALTADAIEGTEGRMRDAGMDGYVTKPIDAANLSQTILSLVSLSGVGQ